MGVVQVTALKLRACLGELSFAPLITRLVLSVNVTGLLSIAVCIFACSFSIRKQHTCYARVL